MQPSDVKTVADAIKIIEERNLTHIKVGVFDIDGILRGKYMSKEKFFKFFKEGFFNMERCSYFEADNLAYTFAGAIAPGDVQDQYLNNRLHKNETITEFVAKQIPCKVEGNGWNQQVVIKEEDVIAFANLVKGILE